MFDIFIRRPVLSCVISLLILLLGLRALSDLPVRQYPDMTNTTITVTTAYPGADADLMQGFVTQPLQTSIASAGGIDYITSTNSAGTSVITVYVTLNYDPNAALTGVMAKVNAVRSQLPSEIQDPVIVKNTGDTISALYLSFFSANHSSEEITDYLLRVIQPQLAVVPGVASPDILGEQKFAMRIWIDPKKMALFDITSADVQNALLSNNVQSAAGNTKGYFDIVSVSAKTDINSVEDFNKMVVKSTEKGLVRLSDIGHVEMGAENANSNVLNDNNAAVFIGVSVTPEANPLTVVSEIQKRVPDIQRELPSGMSMLVAYDSTVFINESINEVMKTIGEAAIIVMVVIFLFMGSFRSVFIPLITMPLSIIGVMFVLLVMGFSINLLTLLALVLAIGLVVDDAIVVVENVHRHIEEGKTPFQAALVGTREIATPVISMTITLAAVYAPIGMMGGLTGSLFKEFALTLAGAVVVSGVIALTLSPMMCSKLLKHDSNTEGLAAKLDRVFDKVRSGYEKFLGVSLNNRPAVVLFALIIFVSLIFLFLSTSSELAPEEDQGAVFAQTTGPASANADYMLAYGKQLGDILDGVPEKETSFVISGTPTTHQGIAAVLLKPWGERDRNQKEIQTEVQGKFDRIPGVKASAFALPALPGASGLPIQFVISTQSEYTTLFEVSDAVLQKATDSGMFIFIDTDLKYDNPQTVVHIDRDKAANYGVTMQDIGTTLATMMGENYTNYMSIQGRSYEVIPETPRVNRLTPEMLKQFYVKTRTGTSIPLSNIVSIERKVQPTTLNQFGQMNSATISGVPMPGVTTGDALAYLEQVTRDNAPEGFSVDYAGPSRQYVQEGNALVATFAFALMIIFLVLAAQFESFRDPIVILVSVPLSICGALIPLALGVATMNIYSQVGLVTLIGLISKHGILICEVAKENQEKEGMNKVEAVAAAAAIRLRPILMTTAAMVAGLFPLLFASGAGSSSRFSIAIVVVTGLLVGTLFTLFVLPVVYTFIAQDHKAEKRDEEMEETAEDGGDATPPEPAPQ